MEYDRNFVSGIRHSLVDPLIGIAPLHTLAFQMNQWVARHNVWRVGSASKLLPTAGFATHCLYPGGSSRPLSARALLATIHFTPLAIFP